MPSCVTSCLYSMLGITLFASISHQVLGDSLKKWVVDVWLNFGLICIQAITFLHAQSEFIIPTKLWNLFLVILRIFLIIFGGDDNNNNNSAFTIFSYMSTSRRSFFNAYIIIYMFYYSRMSKFVGVSKAWRENIFPHRQCMFITSVTSITTFYGIDIIPQNIPTFDLYEKYSMGYC